MTIEKNIQDKKITLSVIGRLDTQTSPELEKEIDTLGECSELVLDLAGVEYISSAGLRVVLKAHKRMSGIGTMKVKNAGESVMEVFEITGFVDFLTIE